MTHTAGSHTSAFKTITKIVEGGMKIIKSDDRALCFELAVRGYRELRLKHAKQKTVVSKISVNSTLKTVAYPEDMVDYKGIAIIDNGEFWFLTRKKNINITTTLSDGSETYDSDIDEGVDVLDKYYGGYATKGGTNTEGYYVEDPIEKRFMLRNTTATQVWLVYITSGVSLSTTTYIPVKYEDAIIAYIAWKSKQWDDTLALNKLLYLEDQYNKAVWEVKKYEGVTLDEIKDLLYELANPLPRR